MTDPKDLQKTALAITRAVGSPRSIIIHSILFLGSFGLATCGSFGLATWGFIDFDRMLLILTTIVSLEAIYLAIFIQMTINYQSQSIAEVQEDVEEIQEDVEEISEDVGELQEDVEEISEDVAEEDVEEDKQQKALDVIHHDLQRLLIDVERLKNNKPNP